MTRMVIKGKVYFRRKIMIFSELIGRSNVNGNKKFRREVRGQILDSEKPLALCQKHKRLRNLIATDHICFLSDGAERQRERKCRADRIRIGIFVHEYKEIVVSFKNLAYAVYRYIIARRHLRPPFLHRMKRLFF